jgi:hypothetical protein
MVAVGPHNAVHLRAVAYQGPDCDPIKNLTSLIQQYTAPEGNELPVPNLWNDPEMYNHFRESLEIPKGSTDFDEAIPFERTTTGRRRRYRAIEYYQFTVHLGNSLTGTITLCLQKRRYYG